MGRLYAIGDKRAAFCSSRPSPLNPDRAVVGGELAGAGEVLFEPPRRSQRACVPTY